MAPIPDRWIPYKACGKIIEGTRIICFKVPLRKAVQVGKREIKEIWDINTLLEKISNLGLVIDLTNTSRYYDPRELQSAGVLYQKILMPGRIIPPEDKVQLFMDSVDEFLRNNCVALEVKKARLGLPTADGLIGVHCTHGLNRTGYMVCRYMRDRLNIPAKTAIATFEKARGYQIERANYVADLLGENPPPADIGKRTKVKPVKEEYTNWRTEDRDTRSYVWNRNKHGENSRKNRTDSERSYDFRSNSAEQKKDQTIEDVRKKRRQEKKKRKRQQKRAEAEEDGKRKRKKHNKTHSKNLETSQEET